MGDTPEEKRRTRLRELSNRLRIDGESSYRATVGWGMLSWGARRETVSRYLEDLEWAGLIDLSIKEDRIRWIARKQSYP